MTFLFPQAKTDSALWLSSTVSWRLVWFRTAYHHWFGFFCRCRISSLTGQNGTTASGQAVIVSPAVPILNRPVRKAEAIPFPQR
jgi:hypothetical protein